MRLIRRFLLLLLVLLPIALVALVWAALAAEPLVETAFNLSRQDLQRAQQIVAEHDPRRLKRGERYKLTLDAKDLNLAVNYLLKRYLDGGVRIETESDLMVARMSLRLPDNPINPYLNLVLAVGEEEGQAHITGMHVGRVPVPGGWVEFVLDQMLQQLLHREDYQLFGDVIKELNLMDGRLQVLYEWQPELLSRVPARLVTRLDQERLSAYYEVLVKATLQPDMGRRVSLLSLFKPLFQLAHKRSRSGSPAAENRALLLVMAGYVSGNGLEALAGSGAEGAAPRQVILTLERRQDFAEHFVLSAALAAAGDAVLADAVGLYKEMSDFRGRSGFSFTDLAADRAGARFGEMATSAASARHVQAVLMAEAVETDIMPRAGDLPEHMGAEAFQRRFGSFDSPAFEQLQQEIDRRIAACRLYQGI